MESVFERYIRCWNDVFALAGRRACVLPFALIAAAKTAVLLLMYFFWHPLVAGFMVPALRTLGEERVLHYPTHVRAFPEMFQASEIVLMVLFGFALTVWAMWTMTDTLDGRKRGWRAYAGPIAILTPSLVVIALIFAGGTIGVPMILNWAAKQVEDRRPMLNAALVWSAFGSAFLARLFLAYTPHFIGSAKEGPFSAIRKSCSFAGEHFALTALIVLTAMIPEKTLEYLASETGVLLKNLRPEWIPALLFSKTVIEVFAWFFCVGALASKLLDRRSA
jgi:hypothetical protein